MRFKYMNWPWQIYFDYLVTCCQICFKKVLTLCGCMRVYINSMHILVTAWTSDKYFFLEVNFYLYICLFACLSKTFVSTCLNWHLMNRESLSLNIYWDMDLSNSLMYQKLWSQIIWWMKWFSMKWNFISGIL